MVLVVFFSIVALQINLKNYHTDRMHSAALSMDFKIQGLSEIKACKYYLPFH